MIVISSTLNSGIDDKLNGLFAILKQSSSISFLICSKFSPGLLCIGIENSTLSSITCAPPPSISTNFVRNASCLDITILNACSNIECSKCPLICNAEDILYTELFGNNLSKNHKRLCAYDNFITSLLKYRLMLLYCLIFFS